MLMQSPPFSRGSAARKKIDAAPEQLVSKLNAIALQYSLAE